MNAQEPERIDVSIEEIERLLERMKSALGAEDFDLAEKIIRSFVHVSRLLEEKGTTIDRLRRLLFGSRTEKLRKILADGREEKPAGDATAEAGVSSEQSPVRAGQAEKPTEGEEQEAERKPEPKAKGHGRNGAGAYTGAECKRIEHPSLKPGDPCPERGCSGKVYQFEPRVFVRVRGQAPLGATVTRIEQLRCNLCLKIFPACSCEGEELGAGKYDATASSMIAVLTYGSGMPFNRLAGLQANLGIPLPASTQWDIIERAAKLVVPAYRELILEAAQGDVLHNDDTPAKILEYMERKEGRGDGG